jgi:hypothetical protein
VPRRRSTESAALTDAAVDGGCHCGFVRFAVRGRPGRGLICNCSICAMKGYVHWIVERERFRLLTPASEAELPVYRFGTGVAAHILCPVCGVAPFYVPRSDPDKVDVNLRCVVGIDLGALALETFDGRDWEAAYERYRQGGD